MRFNFIVAAILCILFVNSEELRAQISDSAKSVPNVLGNDAPYVTIYRKNHPQGRGTQVYHVDVHYFQERVFLVGTNSESNPSQRYMYALDGIELITFPVSDYKEEKRLTVQEIADLPIKQQIDYLRNEASQAKQELKRTKDRLNIKRKAIGRLEHDLARSDDGDRVETMRAELEILNSEMKIQSARLKERQQRYDTQYLDYLRKRRNAIVAGEIE